MPARGTKTSVTVISYKNQEGGRKGRGREGDGDGDALVSSLIPWLDARVVGQHIDIPCHAAGPQVREAEDPFRLGEGIHISHDLSLSFSRGWENVTADHP